MEDRRHPRPGGAMGSEHPRPGSGPPRPGRTNPALVVKAPDRVPANTPTVFLAGSIEMGAADRWQDRASALLSSRFNATQLTILNPRRDSWDASWDQSIEHPGFREQVSWELSGIERSPVVAVFFAADARSPITLFELGLVVGRDKKVIVHAPPGWYRRGNLEVVCDRYNMPLYADEARWQRHLVAACRAL